MAVFEKLAMAMNSKQGLELDQQLSELKSAKKAQAGAMDMAISNLEMKKAEQQAEQAQIKAQEKQSKLQRDLVKLMMDQQPNVAVGATPIQNFVPVEQEAEGLPLLQGLQPPPQAFDGEA